MTEQVAVIGVGQTARYRSKLSVSLAGLVREAALEALADAGLGWQDIDALVIGKAPDMFEGVVMPEIMLAEALGGTGKPVIRVHTAGSVGGSTAIVAAQHIRSGQFDRVLTVCFEKQSESNAQWALSPSTPFRPHFNSGAGGMFAPVIRDYMRISKAPEDIGCRVAVKDRQHACRNPRAQLQLNDISLEQVQDSPMLWEPVRFLEACPSSDGACAMVMVNGKHTGSSANPPAWIHATSMRSEPSFYPWRNEVDPAAGRDCARELYQKAGIRDPRKELDCAEIYVPFSWFEPIWLENLGFAEKGEGWKLTLDGATHIDGGDIPWNCSGGVLSSNPIGASGMIRFAEAALQVRGMAGDHQVANARKAMGHAYGGHNQFFAMWIVGADKPA